MAEIAVMKDMECLDSSTQESARQESVSEMVSETTQACSIRTLLAVDAYRTCLFIA